MTGAVLILRIGLSALAATVAALAAERALHELGRQARGIWVAALLGTAGMTGWLLAGGSLPLGLPGELASIVQPAAINPPATTAMGHTDGWPALLVPLWTSSSLGLALLLAAGAWRQRRDLAAGRRERFGRFEATVCPAFGPAAVGVLHPRIVIPEWLLSRPIGERQLVLRHEAEHAAARDPLVTWTGLCLVCLLPWHPVIWYQFRRLRLAIELDCDARVTQAEPDRLREYGELLVELAGRGNRRATLGAALGVPRTFLERRIQMITRRRRGLGSAVVWAAGAVVLGVLACTDATGPVAEEAPRATVLRPISGGADAGTTVQLNAVALPEGEQSVELRAVAVDEGEQPGVLRALVPTENGINATYREDAD